MPDYVALIRTARWLGVAPWELAQQSVFWFGAAARVAYGETELERVERERAQEQFGGNHGR